MCLDYIFLDIHLNGYTSEWFNAPTHPRTVSLLVYQNICYSCNALLSIASPYPIGTAYLACMVSPVAYARLSGLVVWEDGLGGSMYNRSYVTKWQGARLQCLAIQPSRLCAYPTLSRQILDHYRSRNSLQPRQCLACSLSPIVHSLCCIAHTVHAIAFCYSLWPMPFF